MSFKRNGLYNKDLLKKIEKAKKQREEKVLAHEKVRWIIAQQVLRRLTFLPRVTERGLEKDGVGLDAYLITRKLESSRNLICDDFEQLRKFISTERTKYSFKPWLASHASVTSSKSMVSYKSFSIRRSCPGAETSSDGLDQVEQPPTATHVVITREWIQENRKPIRFLFDGCIPVMEDEAILQQRVAECCQTCKFLLPVDLREFQKLNVHQYLLGYCRVSDSREKVYRSAFNKTKQRGSDVLPLSAFETALSIVLVTPINKSDLAKFCRALDINESTRMDLPLFLVICAFAERVFYLSLIQSSHGVYETKGRLERLDFSNVETKLQDLTMDKSLVRLLISV
ncbi:uncharacterized protein LOC131945702 [Physella acuta]|uniref:uncharacterized protein LOC131945702 n=1 Tax=Physella acuta TaxID=109671 RepID=UPI0027DD6627|nr:uncharacterized protein LOC131945702 [Physella acuta]